MEWIMEGYFVYNPFNSAQWYFHLLLVMAQYDWLSHQNWSPYPVSCQQELIKGLKTGLSEVSRSCGSDCHSLSPKAVLNLTDWIIDFTRDWHLICVNYSVLVHVTKC